jgi:hypothetical protein
MLDGATITLIDGLGGLKAIGISHPRFYTTMVEWSRAFGGVPIHLHAHDDLWIMRPDPSIQLWNGETLELLPDVTLASLGSRLAGTNSDPRPKTKRSNEFRFGARRRARLLMTNWCFSNKDSATTTRTPPGRRSLAMVASRWTASMSR